MSQHQVEIVHANHGEWYARCSCKAHSDYGTRADAEDWEYLHHQQVQRARTHLRGRAPSLRDQYAYYRRMAEDLRLPAEDRDLWRLLADGLEHRLGHAPDVQAMF